MLKIFQSKKRKCTIKIPSTVFRLDSYSVMFIFKVFTNLAYIAQIQN